MEELYVPDSIRTVSGKYVNVFNPTPEMICIEDIAHSLSQQCRFGGHLPKHYSVAEHSINCSLLIEKDKSQKLAALLHDATEAYILDIPTPIKRKLLDYKEIEDRLMSVIAEKFNIDYPFYPEIKEVDTKMLEIEWDCLMLNKYPFPFQRGNVKERFLKTFKELYG